MRLARCCLILGSFLLAAACSEDDKSSGGTGGTGGNQGTGGATGGRGGSGGSGGTGGTTGGSGGGGGSTTGGSGGSTSGGTGGGGSGGSTGGSGGSGGGSGGAAGDGGRADGAETGGGSDAGGDASSDLPAIPPRPPGPIDLEGWIPTYDGPPVGPEVKMDCPEDPTAGFTEYKDEFRVEHPHDLPVTDRFSVDNGIYTFWVRNGDKRHNPTSTARHPRTEGRWRQNFRTGIRMMSADVFWERNVNNGTIVMQVHTTTTGIGPVYMVAEGNNVSPINGSRVPGGLYDRWINLKVEINSATTGSRYWVNNCLVATKGSGVRGDGNNYFKLGVYHCDAGTCRARAKNIKLYMK